MAVLPNQEYFDQSIVTNLSFALLPIDDFTGQTPIGRLKLRIKQLEYSPIINKSGYYLFLDLVDKLEDEHSLIIQSEDKYYLNKSISIKDIKQQALVNNLEVRIPLIPSPSYPFGPCITLVRGTVLTQTVDEDNNSIIKPVSGAKVEIDDLNLTYETGNSGDFVFYFNNLKENDIIEKDEKKFIRMGANTETDLIVTCPGFKKFRKSSCEVEIGKTTAFAVTLLKGG